MKIIILEENEVECPYCYAIYDVVIAGLCFSCGGCDSDLEIGFDEDGVPCVENY